MAVPERPLALSIHSARMERQLTQGELAASIGVTQSTVSFWESGVEAPTVEHLILLALELPEIIETFDGRERELLRRVLRLERELFAGRCACVGCSCQTEVAT
jgi:transcriptional regulator with XRE-family HTH domain